MSIMLTPFCYPEGEQWRSAMCGALNSLLGASGSTLELAVPNEPIIGGCPDLARTLEALLPPPDWMLRGLERRRRLALNVAGFSDIYDVEEVKRTPFYHDVVIPNRLFEPLILAADFAGLPLPAVLGFVFGNEHGATRNLERNKQMLNLLVPAYIAGVAAYVRMARQRACFGAMIDSVSAGVTIVGIDGAVVDENQAMKRLVHGDPDGGRIRVAVRQLSSGIANIVARAAPMDWANQSRLTEIRTSLARYRITATLVPDGFLHARSAVVALTERMTARSLDREELATQFRLTSREIETAQLLGRGYSTRQVAAAMGISVNTARRHTEHVLEKLDVHSRAAVGARLARIS
jgi:DNA-binding CsgD family transcriptional regulator